jgi:Uma2 family endonuclease
MDLDPPLAVHRFSVAQYHRMIESGVLTENDRVELLEGCIVSKMPHNPAHDATVSVLLKRLWPRLPDNWFVRVQSAITLSDSEPEPDLAVVRGPEDRYLARHPVAREVALVIEVSESSLLHDRTIKARLYARARIPVYWVVNVSESQIEVFTLPRAGKEPAYREARNYKSGESISLSIAGNEVGPFAVRELLPRAHNGRS